MLKPQIIDILQRVTAELETVNSDATFRTYQDFSPDIAEDETLTDALKILYILESHVQANHEF